jgi:hypothetical protein
MRGNVRLRGIDFPSLSAAAFDVSEGPRDIRIFGNTGHPARQTMEFKAEFQDMRFIETAILSDQ